MNSSWIPLTLVLLSCCVINDHTGHSTSVTSCLCTESCDSVLTTDLSVSPGLSLTAERHVLITDTLKIRCWSASLFLLHKPLRSDFNGNPKKSPQKKTKCSCCFYIASVNVKKWQMYYANLYAHKEDTVLSLKHHSCEEHSIFDNQRPQEIVPLAVPCHLTDVSSTKEAIHTENYQYIIQLKDMRLDLVFSFFKYVFLCPHIDQWKHPRVVGTRRIKHIKALSFHGADIVRNQENKRLCCRRNVFST